MVRLASGYVMKPEVAMKVAEKLEINPAANNPLNARMHINRHIRKLNPRGPSIHTVEYAPFKPNDTWAFVLVTKYDDDNRDCKFAERPVDLRMKQIFMEMGELEDGDIWWDTVHCWW